MTEPEPAVDEFDGESLQDIHDRLNREQLGELRNPVDAPPPDDYQAPARTGGDPK